ncbi:MAG: hypothetical protein ACRBCI_14090 [Cellvibrionaceae bacterium]
MEKAIAKNTLVGLTTDDTLTNINGLIGLLRYLNFEGDINETGEYGLFVLHTLIRDSLDYEIDRIKRGGFE